MSSKDIREPRDSKSDEKKKPKEKEKENEIDKDKVMKQEEEDAQDLDGTKPDFIYCGPFIKKQLPAPFIDTACPLNQPQSGIFSQSYAYHSLKERLPIILTKMIDRTSGGGGGGGKDEKGDKSKETVHGLAKIKHDLVTNKDYELFVVDEDLMKDEDFLEDSVLWNKWIEDLELRQNNYFNNNWLFTETYVYRKAVEAAKLQGMNDFDPFKEEKEKMIKDNIEPMCVVAEKLVDTMLDPEKPTNEKKADFSALAKVCMWANKVDLHQSLIEDCPFYNEKEEEERARKAREKAAKLKEEKERLKREKKAAKKGKPVPPPPPKPPEPEPEKIEKLIDPWQMNLERKDRVLSDDSGKAFGFLDKKLPALQAKIEKTIPKTTCACEKIAKKLKLAVQIDPVEKKKQQEALKAEIAEHAAKEKEEQEEREARGEGEGEGENAPPPWRPPPCPAKITLPACVVYDIVCGNAGYDLFTDLCFATYIVKHDLVKKVRFHLKKIPMFASDATTKDFHNLINKCKNASFTRTVPPQPKPPPKNPKKNEPPPPPPEDEEPPQPRTVTSDQLQELGRQWEKWVEDGTFKLYTEDYWTWPHMYKDMKKYDYWLYRKLQLSGGMMLKGEVNYRRLVGDNRTTSTQKMAVSCQGFNPCPIIAIRVVKTEVGSGMKKGKWEQLTKEDSEWMRKGDYGQIHFLPKAEKCKPADRPCDDYGETCIGVRCIADPELYGAEPKAEE